ncbi:Mycothiol maleylpyruvate isomerase N-terminal domain-containing protein [Raineyella antarctica]|uniref:Mycothiol maleylpyruvate isomerase N-terminal domain-containing protein n=1 Tax=Raineyella antarctica TaxID=1577474 RepID=A0A1G6GDU8_9ACTN|nr:sterol carrier family protein [Raineyella antarctica]SDB80079.1 Mycothiol maleylpyruvate isomerase N-terminal domain-containing protein [Raineyella antarctica]
MRSQRQVQQLRQTLVDALHTMVETTRALHPEDYALPAPLPGWDVRLLTGLALGQLTDMAAQLERPSVTRPVNLDVYATHMLATASRRHSRAAAIADRDSGPRLGEQLISQAEELAVALGEGDLPPVVDTGAGQLSLLDFLRVHVTEIAVYCDDMRRGLAVTDRKVPPADRAVVATAVRALADVLAARTPGQAIEVRVPPFAAVQIGDPAATPAGRLVSAPTHTRGTPPAVIEMDPATFLQLCAGRLAWGEAVSTHAVSASGQRADLSRLLPVMQ